MEPAKKMPVSTPVVQRTPTVSGRNTVAVGSHREGVQWYPQGPQTLD